MTKKTFIKDFENGETLDGVLLGINQFKKATGRNGKPYLDLEFVDKSGSIKAKVWAEGLAKIDETVVAEGEIVSVNGIVGEFNGIPQLTINFISKVDEGDYDLGDFLPATTKNVDELWEKVEDHVDDISDSELKALLEKLLTDYESEIRLSPAASGVHHHYIGGLLEHIVEMLEICDAVLKLYPEADPSLVIAGVIFHDIGKIRELKVDGFRIAYTKEGKLLGHISIGFGMLNKLAKDIVSDETRLRLGHIILSHHFVLEYGSPVTPKTIEAMIVSKVDDLSSKVRLVQKVLKNNEENPSEFAPREFGLDGEVYLGK